MLSDVDHREATYAFGYIFGAADAAQILKPDLFYQPNYTVKREFLDAVSKYLEGHPERRHQSAAGLVGFALAQSFLSGKGKAP